jgi:uncharacterized membrane protein
MNPFDLVAVFGLSTLIRIYWPLLLCFGSLVYAYKLTMAYAENTDAERDGVQSLKARFIIRMVYLALFISLVSLGYWFEVHVRLLEWYISGNEELQEIYKTAKERLTNT